MQNKVARASLLPPKLIMGLSYKLQSRLMFQICYVLLLVIL